MKHDFDKETTTETEDSFESFTSQALRIRQKGSFETLLAQHLVVAVPSDPLSKVRLISECCYMVPSGKLDLNMKLVETIYLVCLSFLNTQTKTGSVNSTWGFPQTEKNYKRFIKPWHRDVPLSFVYDTRQERMQKDKLREQSKTEAQEFFLFTCHLDLSLGSFQILKVQFLSWSIPLIMQIFEKISRIIDPDLYRELLGVLKPQNQGEA